MSWEVPAGLWLGLAVPAIVALWLLRPRRVRLRVPSLLLWPGSPAQRQSARPWQRLRNHPLLWLQVVAATLLALAAARPFVPASAAGRHLVVLLDASGSMRARDPSAGSGQAPSAGSGPVPLAGSGQAVAPDRFGAARAAVLDLARGLGPGQEMAVIRVDEQPRVLVAGAHEAAEVERALRDEAPAYGPADGAAALALAAGLTRGPAEWVLVGDGGVAFPEDARRPAGTSFRFVPVGGTAGQQAANVAVTGLVARQSESGSTLQAGVRNTGPRPVSGRLQLLAEGQLVGVREWQAGPGEAVYLTWTDLPLSAAPGAGAPRWYEARLSGVDPADNLLEQDDRAWAALGATGEPRVLLVSPGNTFLERVLAVQGGLRAFRTAPADWPGVAAAQPGAANAPAGGGAGATGSDGRGAGAAAYPLTVFDRFWPDALPEGNSLLVGPSVGEAFHPQQVWLKPSHPLLSHVDWSDVRIAAAHQVPLDGSWETVIGSDGGPLLAVRTDGGRRQAVLAFDLSQSDLALRPAFPILAANLLDWLLPRPDDAPRSVAPGAAVSIDPAPLARRVWAEAVEPPGSAHIDLAPPWPPLPFHPPAPGLYRIVQEGEAGSQEQLVVAEGYHPAEATLNVRAPSLPAADGGGGTAAARSALPLWPWLGGAVLALSLAEWWVDARGR